MHVRSVRLAVGSGLLAVLNACATAPAETPATVVQPGRPGEPSRDVPATAPSAPARHTAADVQFVHGMIAHHAQALAMTALVPPRTSATDLRLLAQRIELSQQDEIARMQRWLRQRGEAAAAPEHMQHTLLPGMLTADELKALEAARNVAFERLFLELMIRHHEGALTMVAQLLATPGAAQDVELYRFASDVDADQRAEIERMRALLSTRR